MSGEHRISRDERRLSRTAWYWQVEWRDDDDCGHGIGGWAHTRLGARFACWRIERSER